MGGGCGAVGFQDFGSMTPIENQVRPGIECLAGVKAVFPCSLLRIGHAEDF